MHAKVYVADSACAVVTSANLTDGGLPRRPGELETGNPAPLRGGGGDEQLEEVGPVGRLGPLGQATAR
jgi:hypothetical protein